MKESTHGLGHDLPITDPDEDLLNSVGVARSIHRVLQSTPRNWSTRIGLTGPWGSGKTSVLNLLRRYEEEDDAIVVSFSVWAASGEGSVITHFYEALSRRLREIEIQIPAKQKAKNYLGRLSRFGRWLSIARRGAEEFSPAPPIATKAALAVIDGLASQSAAWTRIGNKDLDALVAALAGRRVVVFVDDLDRADPKVIPKSLLAMRELLDWPGFAFVLAFDKEAVAGALYAYSTVYGQNAQGFLDKIIDVPFAMPHVDGVGKKLLADATFQVCCSSVPSEVLEGVIAVLPAEPRRIKIVARTVGALHPTLSRHSPQEVDWVGVLLLAIVRESSAELADWVVAAAKKHSESWLLWASNDDEKEKKVAEVREMLRSALPDPHPKDLERVVEAALRLLEHWQYVDEKTIDYWVNIAFDEPIVTAFEFSVFRENVGQRGSESEVERFIDELHSNSRSTRKDVSSAVLQKALDDYQDRLSEMADSSTDPEWQAALGRAKRSLLAIEKIYSEAVSAEVSEAAQSAQPACVLYHIASRWIAWTRNAGEIELRAREKYLALAAIARCTDPAAVFSATDPYWNNRTAQSAADAQLKKEWSEEVRSRTAPAIASALCDRMRKSGGMIPIASGEDALNAWFLETRDSPLYNQEELTVLLVQTFRSGLQLDAVESAALSENAIFYLRQILFQTRNASWGGLEHARDVNKMRPEILPAAWSAAVLSPVPFRMRSQLRKLRDDLLGVGVPEKELAEPAWLAATVDYTKLAQ